MRLARRSATGARGRAASARASPYRAPGEGGAEEEAPRSPVGGAAVAGLCFVFGCSLLRFGIFALRPERFGVDPALALAASAASAYSLARVLGR